MRYAFLRSVLILLVALAATSASAQTTLWFTLVPPPDFGQPPITRLARTPSDVFVFNSKSPGGVSLSVNPGTTDFEDLLLSPPPGELFATGPYEQAIGTLPGIARGGLGLFASAVGGQCQHVGRFVVLDLAYDSNFDLTTFAADFEIRCDFGGGVYYGELRYNSAIPLTVDKAANSTTPDAFAFFPRTMVAPGTTVASNPTTLYGMNAPAPISIVGGEYSLNGGAFTSAPGTASNRDRVVVRQTTAPSYGMTTSATLTVGGVSAQFNASTVTPGEPFTALVMQSETPNVFSGGLLDAREPDWQFGVLPASDFDSAILSFQIVGPAGELLSVAFAPAPGQPFIPGPYEATARAVFRGASPGLEASGCTPKSGRFVVHEIAWKVDGTLDRFAASFEQWCFEPVGPIHGDIRFNSTVLLPSMLIAPRATPYPFALSAQSPVRAGALVRSNVTVIDGIDVPVPISVTGGEYSINGGPFTSVAGMANSRDEVVVQLVASSTPGGMRSATLSAGGQSATFSVGTYLPGMVLSGLYFQSTSGEYVGGGATRLLLTPPNIVTLRHDAVTDVDARVLAVGGVEWDAIMQGPDGARPVPGSYEKATRFPFQAPGVPGFDFSGDGRGCNNDFGRFVVHEATYAADGTLQTFAADFEQHCEFPTGPPLFGEVRFNSTVPFSALVAGACTPADPACVADLAVTQSGSSSSTLGQDVILTLSVTNHGPGTAHNVSVVDTLPSGRQLASAPAGCSLAGSTVRCVNTSLASGDTLTYVLVLHPSLPGPLVSAVNVTADEIDPVPANNDNLMTVQVAAPARTVNISTRGRVGVDDEVLIGGFIIGGATPKTVVVTAIGPALFGAGIPDALANPTLTLVRSSDGAVLATNDDWGTATNAAAIQQSGFAPADVREAAIMLTLPPGAYTAIVSGAGRQTGVGIVAVYEVDHPEVPLVNISTRGHVLTGNDVMIGGFVIQGAGPRTVVVTGIGPSLVAAGIPNALPNPRLVLVRSSDQSVVATNDDWGSAPNASDIQATGFAPADAREPAIMVTLPPGAYTAVLSDAAGATGVGIVAVYSVP